MAATNDSGNGHGSIGNPQQTVQETEYSRQAIENESAEGKSPPPKYVPTKKHVKGHTIKGASEDPIKTIAEGQRLLDTGYKDGKQIYNITDDRIMVKFQPDRTPQNGYHAYRVSKQRDIPASVLKKLLEEGKISKTEYRDYRKGKRK